MKRFQLGRQVLGELTFCNRERLDEISGIEQLLREAAARSGATLISVHVHRFQPYGVSGVAILAESHLAIHTWPELGYAAVDAFTCGDHVDPMEAITTLERGLEARCTSYMTLNRGMDPSIPLMNRLYDEQRPPS